MFDSKTRNTGCIIHTIFGFLLLAKADSLQESQPHPPALLILFMQDALTGKQWCVNPERSHIGPPSLHAPVDIYTQKNNLGFGDSIK